MPYLNKRENIALAYQMKREKEAQLQAQIRIAENLLMAARNDLARLRKLEGQKLVAEMFWESPEEVLKPKMEYHKQLEHAVTGGWA